MMRTRLGSKCCGCGVTRIGFRTATRCVLLISCLAVCVTAAVAQPRLPLSAGAAIADVTPRSFPVLVNGGMRANYAEQANTRINARAIVFASAGERIGIVVVDSCMMPRPLLDEAKQMAAKATKLKPDHILISATHTHTAPSSMGALGTPPQDDYLPVLRAGIVEALANAEKNLQPAKVGWATENASELTALRRWILRPDRLRDDPFGNPTVRATMHAGSNWDHVTGESGPEDPDLCLLSVQALDGRPIALLANFSMHYFSGQKPLAADYFGLFSDGMQEKLRHNVKGQPPFVAMMSHGCSGDIWRRDYKQPADKQNPFPDIESYTNEMIRIALKGYESITYTMPHSIAMAEQRMQLNYRTPDLQRLKWAEQIVEAMGDRLPETQEEIYAREQIILHERQSTEVVVQGLRIGEFGIATTPNETYALTGLKIKHQSPLKQTMVIELANGGDGYIPPPEQHLLGGYNTWAARSAGLEVQAEPKITETAIQLLESVTRRSRRTWKQSDSVAASAIAKRSPTAWYRLDEFNGPTAMDATGNFHDATYEPAIAYFLAGPAAFDAGTEKNRCVHFAGDRLRARLPIEGSQYSVSMWVWNGMPLDARPVAGWMFSRGRDSGLGPQSEHLGIAGTEDPAGCLIFQNGRDSSRLTGRTPLKRWTWNHILLVRDGNRVRVWLNGASKPEIDGVVPAVTQAVPLFFGGRSDKDSNWEGRLDEVSVFDSVLTGGDAAALAGTK